MGRPPSSQRVVGQLKAALTIKLVSRLPTHDPVYLPKTCDDRNADLGVPLVPSQENHDTAISSLKSSFGGGTNLVLYGMYNDLWKKDGATTYGAEKYWGVSHRFALGLRLDS